MKKILFIFIIVISSIVKKSQAQSNIISTVGGNGIMGYSGDGGQATNAELFQPHGIAFDVTGNMYIADETNNLIRKINTLGIITTIAGTGAVGYSGDGGQATAAELKHPTQVVIDMAGNIYISDYFNNCIRKVNTAGIISTIAGNGTGGFSGDGGQATAAALNWASSLFMDTIGNLFIADEGNNRIRMVNTNGIITTIAGNGTAGYNGDGGQATAAELHNPFGVFLDAAGSLYISDAVNNCIRKVNTAGIITTIAGTGTAGYSGDGGQATNAGLSTPAGNIAIDATGNMYIPDSYNHRIRMINTSGIISTIAGTGTQGFSGDCGQATAAELYLPQGVTINAGNIYIADYDNNRIRVVSTQTCTTMGVEQVKENSSNLLAYPNPFAEGVTIKYFVPENTTNAQVIFYDELGNQLKTFTIAEAGAGQLNVGAANLANGTYSYSLIINGKVVDTKKMIKTN